MDTQNSTYKQFFVVVVTCMWLLCLSSQRGEYPVSRNILLFLLVLAAFITRSRSWLLQSILLSFASVVRNNKQSKLFKYIAGVLGIGALVIILTFLFPNITQSLLSRGFADTRSGQYVVFFSQYTIWDLLLGKGLHASYVYLGRPNYVYFDNQFMFLMFHYGMLPAAAFMVFYLTLYRGGRSMAGGTEISGAKISGAFLILAFLGLSVYFQIGWQFNILLTMMQLGHAVKQQYWRSRS